MKKHSAFRLVPVSVVLCLLLLAVLPSTMLAADKSIKVWPGEAAVGGKVKVVGGDYDEGYPAASVRYDFVFVTVYFSSEAAEVGERVGTDITAYAMVDASCKVDEFGRFESGFRVPEELADGATFGDVEEDLHYVYVTYWNDDVIVAANVLEVTEVADQFFYPVGYPHPVWWTFPGCWDCCDDELPWDGISYYPYPWIPPHGWPDDWPEDWPEEWPYAWLPMPHPWHSLPIPPCGC